MVFFLLKRGVGRWGSLLGISGGFFPFLSLGFLLLPFSLPFSPSAFASLSVSSAAFPPSPISPGSLGHLIVRVFYSSGILVSFERQVLLPFLLWVLRGFCFFVI